MKTGKKQKSGRARLRGEEREQMSMFPTRILLATDGSEDSELAAWTAVDLFKNTGSELHVVYVGEFLPTIFAHTETQPAGLEREARKLLEEQLNRVEAHGGTVTEAHLRLGEADTEIVALAEEIGVDLIVVGSRGRSPLKRTLMGSVSDSVVRHAHCPVLVVRGGDRRQSAVERVANERERA
jgi:nucleotide-binding universal stress UspA family protein